MTFINIWPLSLHPLNLYNSKSRALLGRSKSEIKVLTVKDGEGRELDDARFVEVLRSAGTRIKSATSDGKLLMCA